MPYPVTFDIQPPARFDKTQVFIRILIVIILSLLAGFISWIIGAVYLIFPVAAAILISQKGTEQFFSESDRNIGKWLRYVVAAFAYMAFLTDRLPNQDPAETFQLSIQPGGDASAGSALLRIIMAIPHAIVLGIVSLAFIVVLPVAAISILISESYPAWVYNFTRGYLRWETRVLGYMASLTDDYPPFSFRGDEPVVSPPPSEPPQIEPAGDAPSE